MRRLSLIKYGYRTLRHGPPRYISLKHGKWAYLAAWTDLFTRKIVGWAIDTSMTQELIIIALSIGIKRYKPSSGLILHSDRGGQYFGLKFK
ncbi:DDE-type integrase/transposase/recombinase [Runella limosa]|uniref:DDE-type integrase/transposase/recombinase n=1 Tax=Runella limosa TaxID=370978 RepID=UPI0035B67225